MPKGKIKEINKKYLLKALASVREFYKAKSEKKENLARNKWKRNCCKAFGVENIYETIETMNLKDLTCDLQHYEDEKVIEVFKALGYKIVE